MNGNSLGSPPDTSKTVRNVLLAVVAIALSVAIFLGSTNSNSASSLEFQAQQSTDLETALTDGKPTFIEFYANWCTSCQAMAPDLAALKQEYSDTVDFVMLNVDNAKWLPEVLRYRVDGIPHFVYVNSQGEAIAQSIGEQPRALIQNNLDALIADLPLPHSDSIGEVSQFSAPVNTPKQGIDDPRSHGQPVN